MTTVYRDETTYPEDVRRMRMNLIRELGRPNLSWMDRMAINEALEEVNNHAASMVAESRITEPESWGIQNGAARQPAGRPT
jgi:hypothetical protein